MMTGQCNATLLTNIPGLMTHRTFVPEPVVEPPKFDRAEADRLMREAVRILNSYYPEGALFWLRENRPLLIERLREAEAAVDAQYLKDIVAFRQALRGYVDAHQEAFKVFEEKLPVVEVQEGLF